jgi:hypothetical protein
LGGDDKSISPLTLTLSPQGREKTIHPPSRAGGYSGIFL